MHATISIRYLDSTMNSIILRLRKAYKLLSYFTWHIYDTVISQRERGGRSYKSTVYYITGLGIATWSFYSEPQDHFHLNLGQSSLEWKEFKSNFYKSNLIDLLHATISIRYLDSTMNSIKLRLRKAYKLSSYFTWHIYVTVISQYHIKFFEHAPREFKR